MSDTPTEKIEATKAPAGWKVKSKFMAIGLLVGLIGGGAGAGKVYLDASGTIETLEASAASANDRDSALQARAAVAATETELEAQNLGNARKHLEVAKLKLAEVDKEAGHLDASILATITERLNAVNISDGSNTVANTALDEIGLALDRELIRSN
ncbi:MAG: hypothetical protein ACI8RZ_002946 [Myxococcota bacterium]|jgi:hypothetical protein